MIKKISLCIMAAFYFGAGIYHFLRPELYEKIMPGWLPWQRALIYITGACEILFSILLFPITTRRAAAWGIIILLILVFPANVQMMLNYWHQRHPGLWLSILRLPMQALLIWWAYGFTQLKKTGG